MTAPGMVDVMDFFAFLHGMRGALWQCGQTALALKGRVTREMKPADLPGAAGATVSVVDRICQELLLLRAHEISPGLEVVSEEMDSCSDRVRALFAGNGSRWVLVLDPLDGTECYLRGESDYAHMAGILDSDRGRIQCTAVYFPERARLYYAVRGGGAWVVSGFDGPARRIEPVAPPRSYGRVKRLSDADRGRIERLGFVVDATHDRSAADDLVAVADGRMGAMVMRDFHGYDTALPGLLVEEAGGALLGPNGADATYSREMPRVPLVIASLSREFAGAIWQALSKEVDG
ncbi:MAG: inositol monophosphatase family protein [Myxococcota bacterium]